MRTWQDNILAPAWWRELEREIVLNNGAGTGDSLGLDVGMQGGRFMLEHFREVSARRREHGVPLSSAVRA